MLLNKYNPEQAEKLMRSWMTSGFLKPRDLARSSEVLEKTLTYLPFWVISVAATTSYKGVFERLIPPVMKEGEIKKKYNWLVLARKATHFPTREYDVPLDGKVSYDFRKIEGFAKVLNSEMEKRDAVELTRQQIESHHRFLAQQDVDKIIEMNTDARIGEAVYLHAPIWRIVYEYEGVRYQVLFDGATGMVIKGDIPAAKLGLL